MADEKTKTNKNAPITFWDNPCAEMMQWDSLDSFLLAITIIWGGIVFLAKNFGMDIEAWPLFFLGAGVLVLIKVTIRLLNPAYPKSLLGDLLWTGFLFWLGDWDNIWPFIIIAIGVYALFGDRLRNRLTF